MANQASINLAKNTSRIKRIEKVQRKNFLVSRKISTEGLLTEASKPKRVHNPIILKQERVNCLKEIRLTSLKSNLNTASHEGEPLKQ